MLLLSTLTHYTAIKDDNINKGKNSHLHSGDNFTSEHALNARGHMENRAC